MLIHQTGFTSCSGQQSGTYSPVFSTIKWSVLDTVLLCQTSPDVKTCVAMKPLLVLCNYVLAV